ncbi:MAG: hypothetical protein JWM96_1380 [Alphaproteobacteria bacterium]|nr:hypothetical protein [Alphaproteobacteria bacterium]
MSLVRHECDGGGDEARAIKARASSCLERLRGRVAMPTTRPSATEPSAPGKAGAEAGADALPQRWSNGMPQPVLGTATAVSMTVMSTTRSGLPEKVLEHLEHLRLAEVDVGRFGQRQLCPCGAPMGRMLNHARGRWDTFTPAQQSQLLASGFIRHQRDHLAQRLVAALEIFADRSEYLPTRGDVLDGFDLHESWRDICRRRLSLFEVDAPDLAERIKALHMYSNPRIRPPAPRMSGAAGKA